MSEVHQLLIAAETLVIFLRRHMGRIDKEFAVAERRHGKETPWKTRDRYQDIRDKYWHLYDDIYSTIEELKTLYPAAGVDGFIKRHFEKVMDVLGDKLKESDRRAAGWEQLVLNPEIYKDEEFIKHYGDVIKN
jgi:hypothetical protein